MSAPTVRELVGSHKYAPCACDDTSDIFECQLSARVEAVIAEIEGLRSLIGGDPYHSGNKILRLLDGEKP